MKYFVIAGEASGDIHASQLIKALRSSDNEAEFRFFGGDFMEQASGVAPEVHYKDMAYMGFIEVIKHLGTIMGFMKTARQIVSEWCPDAVVLVDYPSFNLKIAKYAHSLNIPVFYYISPKVWAWKEYRVKQIKKYVTRLFSILPFEVEFFKKHDYEVTYVGNPSVEEIEQRMQALPSVDDFITTHNLESRPILALVPGSRKGEIRNNLPIMLEVAKRFPQYQAVIAGAPGIDASLYTSMTSQPVVTGVTFELMSVSQAALVTSGTSTLEAALLRTPQVVCYRANGSKLSYNLFKRILKIPFVSLPNLIAGREIVKEMLLHYCEPEGVSLELSKVIPGGDQHQSQLDAYADMRSRLGTNKAAETTARLIYEVLTK